MSYNKPGIEVDQKQLKASPGLIPPDLLAVVIGDAYYVDEISENPDSEFTHEYSDVYNNSAITVTISGLDADWPSVDPGSVYVDLIGNTRSTAGNILHLTSDDFSVPQDIDLGHTTVSINAGLGTAWVGAAIKIGYRAQKNNLTSLLNLGGQDEIKDRIGLITSINPLAMAASLCMQAANSTIYAYGTDSTDLDHADALDYLSSKELYVMVPLAQDATILSAYRDHVNFFSQPEQKRLRITIQNRNIPWVNSTNENDPLGQFDEGYQAGKDYLGDTAQLMKFNALQYGERRVFWTMPDVCYLLERRHISTLNSTYLDHINGSMGLPAILAGTVTMSSGKKYYVNSELTDAVWEDIQSEYSFLTCYIPVPGYYLATVTAGMISAYAPSDPFTNVPISGISRIKYSNDVFSETRLNTIAEGGNYIFVQMTDSSPIYCRHQLSTDMATIERRELSITKALDFCSKFIADSLAPYIGRYNITPDFLNTLGMTFSAIANYLIAKGHVVDVKLEKLYQDPDQPDSIKVTISVKVKYPVNYIKITLVF